MERVREDIAPKYRNKINFLVERAATITITLQYYSSIRSLYGATLNFKAEGPSQYCNT